MTTKTNSLRPNLGRLSGDQRGAIMVMGVFMALVMAGLLYYLVGLAEAMVMKERMQDAADSSAFAAAIINARGMNILVLINFLMASIIAIAILLKMMVQVSKAAAVLAGVLAFWLPPLATVSTGLYKASKAINGVANTYENTTKAVLTGADKMSDGIRLYVPAVSASKGASIPMEHYAEPVTKALSFPILESLPVYDGSFDRLCEKATEFASDAATFPLGKIPGLGNDGRLVGLAKGLVYKLVVGYGKFYCGATNTPPSTSIKQDDPYPVISHSDESLCDDGDLSACDRYADYVQHVKSSFDVEIGECVHGDRDVIDTCSRRLVTGRSECSPVSGVDDLDEWQLRIQEKRYVYRIVTREDRSTIILDRRDEVGSPVLEKWSDNKGRFSGHKPCFQVNYGSSIGGGNQWSLWSTDSTKPVCHTLFDEPLLSDFDGPSDEVSIDVTEVTDVTLCSREIDKEVSLGGSQTSINSDDTHFEEICECVELGSENLQIRSAVVGDSSRFLAKARHNIKVANLGRPTPPASALLDSAEFLGKFSFAQAEYFVDDGQGNDGHESKRLEWMWHMHWRARLRRARLRDPDSDSCGTLSTISDSAQNHCKVKKSAASSMVEKFEGVADLSIH